MKRSPDFHRRSRLSYFFPGGSAARNPTVYTVEAAPSVISLRGSDVFYSAQSQHADSDKPTETPMTTSKPTQTKQIDYVLVASNKNLSTAGNTMLIHNFLNALQESGVEVEIEHGTAYPQHLFILLTIPDDVVIKLATAYRIDLSYTNPNYSQEKVPYRWFRTDLDYREQAKIVERAPESVMDIRPTKPTNAERSMMLCLLMNRTWFDTKVGDYGVDKMLSREVLDSAYPLHDGSYKWTDSGPLSDRQLLAEYWATFRCLFKKQPLNLIEKYFGTEIAMYFAFIDFYCRYMFPAAVVGLIVYVIGWLCSVFVHRPIINAEVCDSDVVICPLCDEPSTCRFFNLSNQCTVQKTRATFDNIFSSMFAIFMGFWAIFFVFFWKRRLNLLRMKWNVFKIRFEKEIRPEFIAKTKWTRLNRVTGKEEHYIPRAIRCGILTWTNFLIALVAILIMIIVMIIIIVQNRLTFYGLETNDKLLARQAKMNKLIVNALVIILQMVVFALFFPKIAYICTQMEIPSTQYNFDLSYHAKYTILLFANSFSAIFYLAFVKGRAYTYPGGSEEGWYLREITYDLCGPLGCFPDVSVLMGAIFFLSNVKAILRQIFLPMINVFIRKRKRYKEAKTHDLPQWELDYSLLPTKKYALYSEYFDLMVQYGYLICFVVAFPLAPLLAVIRNYIGMRVDARNFLCYHRKYSPKKVRGLGAYNKVINWVTYVGVFINGCMIAFCSSLISYIMYKFHYPTTKGYYHFMLSEFNNEELSFRLNNKSGTCYYPGIRYPPNHEERLTLRTEFYVILVVELIFLVVYEQAILSVRTLLRSSLHEKPKIVKEKALHEDHLVYEQRQKILDDLYKEAQTKKFPDKVQIPNI